MLTVGLMENKNGTDDDRLFIIGKVKSSSKIWKMEQMINFGLDDEKISRKDLKENWDKITIDPARRKFLYLLLWQKKQS